MLTKQPWMKGLWDLSIEAIQANEEGKDLRDVRKELDVLLADPRNPALYAAADALYQRIQQLDTREDYHFEEPDTLEAIRSARGPAPVLPGVTLSTLQLEQRLLGAWLGRTVGCLFGQPVEGWRRQRIVGFLRDTDNLPVRHYMSSQVPPEIRKRYQIADSPGPYGSKHVNWINHVSGMPEDDDITYTVLALKILETYGWDFRPEDVAEEWLQSLPLLRTCTAERVAYLNLSQLILPPRSATHSNPYREWIGAQIRADFYGYINPGDPQTAAEMAFRDASISHVKNGIYGAMLVAAMIAAAFVTDDPDTIVCSGMAQIPKGSRLYYALSEMVENWRQGTSLEHFQDAFYKRFDESSPHDWCHTIPNAMVVVAGVLYHEMDYVTSMAFGTLSGFDTDCNSATIGSIIGAARGHEIIPAAWAEPLSNTLRTSVAGYGHISITEAAARTLALVRK